MAEKGAKTGEKPATSSNPSLTENPAIQITTHKLNGENFLRWAQSVQFFISGRGKMRPEISQGYILYTTTKKIWDTTNLMYSNLGNNFKLYELSAKQGQFTRRLVGNGL
ncbi:hypothetical protein CK203_058451 [Vitis vinifera]|uniref:Retrotransposon Copia-like N-terminal domain-containing protein n=1 Tax=Vitis vinifera TaxID=29760 RepID=A0A438H0T1_VITVI|nr:hypothetical protein CK203_058451 [Vitis vinifera]